MISRIKGVLEELSDCTATVSVCGISYDIFMSPYGASVLTDHIGSEVILYTYYYIMGGNIGPGVPTLLGFPSYFDKEFFERFITVSGIGPKAAIKALSMPSSDIAAAIEREDIKTLKTMPGVGDRTAREIVLKLKGKVAVYIANPNPASSGQQTDITAAAPSALEAEATAVLEQLGYRRTEAERKVSELIKHFPSIVKVEDLIQEFYRQGLGN